MLRFDGRNHTGGEMNWPTLHGCEGLGCHDGNPHCLLKQYRRILNRIHEGGNVYDKNNRGRMLAYVMIAHMASDLRKGHLNEAHQIPPATRRARRVNA